MALTKTDYEWIKEQDAKSGHDMQPIAHFDGQLDGCTKCGGCEGGLPTHCPGAHMSYDLSQRVYHGEIDYRDGRWVNQPTTAMAHVYGVRREPCIEVAVT